METEATPSTIKEKAQNLQLNLGAGQRNSLHQNMISPHGSDLSYQSQSLYSKPTAFITTKDINQAIIDLDKNIKEGKYHRSILRMHKLLGNNSNIPFQPYQVIKLSRRYFECMRKLTKRYFSQIGMTKSQLSNLEKMCERGTYIIDNWYNALCELINKKSEIMKEDYTKYIVNNNNKNNGNEDDEVLDQNNNQTDRTHHSHSHRNSDRSLDDKHIHTDTLLGHRKSSLIRIKEVDDEESEINSPNATSIQQIQDIQHHHSNHETLKQDKIQRIYESIQNKNIIQNINFHMNEFFKANFQIMNYWWQLGKKLENYSIYQTSLFKATQWISHLEKTKDEDLINCFARVYLEIGNFYLEQGQIKESIKNYEICLNYLQKEMLIRGSGEKRQKLMKMHSHQKRKLQNKLQNNILMIVCVMYEMSIGEELQENYSKMLETLHLAEWLTQIYLQGYTELEELIYKASEACRNRYKDLLIEEGEIHIIMDEALGIREEKKRTLNNNVLEDNDFYSYYSKIFYDKYDVQSLNQSLFITIPLKKQHLQSVFPHNNPFINNSNNPPAITQTTSHLIPNNSFQLQLQQEEEQQQQDQQGQPLNQLEQQQQQPSSNQYLSNHQHAPKVSSIYNNNIHSNSSLININNSNTYNNSINNSQTNVTMLQTSKRNQKNLTISGSLNSLTKLGSQANLSQLNTRQSLLDETPTKYRVGQFSTSSKQNIRDFNPTSTTSGANKRNSSMLNNTNTPQSNKMSQSLISMNRDQRQSILNSQNQNTQSSSFSPFQQYQFIAFDNQGKMQQENNLNRQDMLRSGDQQNNCYTPMNTKKRERLPSGIRSMSALTNNNSSPNVLKNSSFKSPEHPKRIQPYQPKLLTTDKYQEKIEEQRKQQIRNQMLHKPQAVQNLDHYFRDKISDELKRLNQQDQNTIDYEFITKGINMVMKEEYFDKDEFQNAYKLLKLKKQKRLLKQGEEVFDKKEPPEIKIKTNNMIQNEIFYQESKQNLKQELSDKKATLKELENQRLAKNLIQDDFQEQDQQKFNLRKILTNQKNNLVNVKNLKESSSKTTLTGDNQKVNQAQGIKAKMLQLKYQQDIKSDLNPQQMAKKGINQEIESIDTQMRNEEKEIVDLQLPKDRRRPHSLQKQRLGVSSQQSLIASEISLSPLHKSHTQFHSTLSNSNFRKSQQNLKRSQLNKSQDFKKKPIKHKSQYYQYNQKQRSVKRNNRLSFIDKYQDISKSTQLLTVKRDVKKATTFVDLAYGSYKLSKLGMDRNKLASSDTNNPLSHKSPNSSSTNGHSISATLQKSLRKLMKLKTTDLQEGSTPMSMKLKQDEDIIFSQIVKKMV